MRKKIALVSAIYPPEPVASAQTSASLARSLAAKGEDVTVVTAFPNRPGGRLYPGFDRRLFQREASADGYRIIRCFAALAPESTLIGRFLENISFGLSAGCALLLLPKPDVIYANTWPIFAAGILMLIARLRRIPVVLSIQDVYPESLVAQGRVRSNSWWVRLARKFDRWIAHQAQTLIVISERFAQIYRMCRQVNPEKIVVVPNWVDETVFTMENPMGGIRKQHSIGNQDFLIVYGGNIGIAAGLDTAIQAMSFVSVKRQVRLLIAGEGSQLYASQDLANQIAPHIISFHTPWQTNETSAVLKTADVLILPTLQQQSAVSVPSKLITYMLSGRPVIALVNEGSDTAQAIRESGCGWVLPPGQPKQLAFLINEISDLPKEELDGMGESGRQYALEYFSSSVNLPKILVTLGVES